MSVRKLNLGRFAAIVLAAFAGGCASGVGGSSFSGPSTSGFASSPVAKVDAKTQQKLYIANLFGGVLVYSAGKNPQLLQTITDGVPKPFSLWVDDTGILYALNATYLSKSPDIAEYEPGAASPFFVLTNDIPSFGYVAVDSSQNVYVTGGLNGSDGKSILELYPKGSSDPSETLNVPTSGAVSGSSSLAFDPSGDLLVGVASLEKGDNAVFRLPSGSQTFTNLGLKKMPAAQIATDAAGNIYAGGGGDDGIRTISVYAPGQTKPSRAIHLSPQAIGVTALTVSANGRLYVASQVSTQRLIYEFAPGASKPDVTLDIPASVEVEGEGLALSP
jgi:hypothetical protein